MKTIMLTDQKTETLIVVNVHALSAVKAIETETESCTAVYCGGQVFFAKENIWEVMNKIEEA